MEDKLKLIILFTLLQIIYISCKPQQQMTKPEQEETQFEEVPNNEQQINPENIEALAEVQPTESNKQESNVPQPQPKQQTHHQHHQKQQQHQQQQHQRTAKVVHAQKPTMLSYHTPPTAIWKQKPLEPSIATVIEDQKRG